MSLREQVSRRSRSLSLIVAALTAALFPALAWGSGRTGTIVLRASRILTVSGEPLEDGSILVRDGRIARVGRRVPVPDGAREVTVEGTVVPGFIDCGSTIGIHGRAAEEFSELTPEMRVAATLDLDDPDLRDALFGGVTVAAVRPGDRNVIGGLGAILHTAPSSLEQSVIRDDAFLCVSLVEDAYYGNRNLRGTEPYTIFHRIPTTRMGTIFLARRAFFEVLRGESRDSGLGPDEGRMTRQLSDTGRKVLAESAAGARRIRIRADAKQEILAALRIAQEFDLRVTIEGFVEGVDLIADVKRAGVDVLIRPGGYVGSPGEASRKNRVQDLPRRLRAAGVPFAYFSEIGGRVERLREESSVDVRFGLPEDAGLAALTLDAARLLGIDDDMGSIEVGKRANLVALSGDPFATTTRVLWVMGDGEIHRRQR